MVVSWQTDVLPYILSIIFIDVLNAITRSMYPRQMNNKKLITSL